MKGEMRTIRVEQRPDSFFLGFLVRAGYEPSRPTVPTTVEQLVFIAGGDGQSEGVSRRQAIRRAKLAMKEHGATSFRCVVSGGGKDAVAGTH